MSRYKKRDSFFLRSLWLSKKLAALRVPNYHEIVADPARLAQAMTASRTNGSSERVRMALAYEGIQFGDNGLLTAARREALHCDTSKNVRYAAVTGLFVCSSEPLFEGRPPHPDVRKGIVEALNDKNELVRTVAKRHLENYDRK